MKWNDIIRDHDIGRNDCGSKVIIRHVDTQTARSVWPDALPHRHGHRSPHKGIGHTLIVYLSGSAKFMAMFRKVDGALVCVCERHLYSGVIYSIAK